MLILHIHTAVHGNDEAGEYVPCYSGYWEVDRNTKEIVPAARCFCNICLTICIPTSRTWWI